MGGALDIARTRQRCRHVVNDDLRTGAPVVGGTGCSAIFLFIDAPDPVRETVPVVPDHGWPWSPGTRRRRAGPAVGGALVSPAGACLVGIVSTRTGSWRWTRWARSRDRRHRCLLCRCRSRVGRPLGNRVQRRLRLILDAAQAHAGVRRPGAGDLPVPGGSGRRGGGGRDPCSGPPCIRIVDLGPRQAARETCEAAASFPVTLLPGAVQGPSADCDTVDHARHCYGPPPRPVDGRYCCGLDGVGGRWGWRRGSA